MRHIAIFLLTILCATGAIAQERQTLGFGRLFTNDYFGDHRDRWRTGGYVFSMLRGPQWDGQRPDAFGQLLEYRLRSEIIAPDGNSNDRPYVGALSFGVHNHLNLSGIELSIGADVVVIGPQTGVSGFQDTLHDAFSIPHAFSGNQLGNAVHFSGTVEAARVISFSDNARIRPFVEAQVGVENLVRVGADLIVGQLGQDDLLLRDVVSGQLYQGIEGDGSGFSFLLGAT